MKYPGENARKNVGIIKDLEYYIHLVDKAAIGFEKIDSNLETISTVCKMLSNSTACYREFVHERRVNRYSKVHCCLIFKNCHNHSNFQQRPL